MQRRRAAAVAGAAAVTALAAVLGLGATFGLFGLTQSDSDAGHLDRAHTATLTRGTGLEAPTASTVDTKPDD
ncbi:MAG: hypothetical protein ACHQIG_03405 [Acidimicrobiia bacterium]